MLSFAHLVWSATVVQFALDQGIVAFLTTILPTIIQTSLPGRFRAHIQSLRGSARDSTLLPFTCGFPGLSAGYGQMNATGIQDVTLSCRRIKAFTTVKSHMIRAEGIKQGYHLKGINPPYPSTQGQRISTKAFTYFHHCFQVTPVFTPLGVLDLVSFSLALGDCLDSWMRLSALWSRR